MTRLIIDAGMLIGALAFWPVVLAWGAWAATGNIWAAGFAATGGAALTAWVAL